MSNCIQKGYSHLPKTEVSPGGREYISTYSIDGYVWGDDGEPEYEPNCLNWSQSNTYKVFLALGLIPDGANVDDLPDGCNPLPAGRVYQACHAFNLARAGEFACGQSPMMAGLLETLGAGGARIIDMSQRYGAEEFFESRIGQLKALAQESLAQYGEFALIFIGG